MSFRLCRVVIGKRNGFKNPNMGSSLQRYRVLCFQKKKRLIYVNRVEIARARPQPRPKRGAYNNREQ
jgi:hypothetical protein